VVVLAVAVLGVMRYGKAAPAPPAIQADLDPTVVAAVEKARLAVMDQPRSAATWGRLGMVLLAHDFPAEATTCLAHAEQLDSREPRWPYYQGIALHKEEPDRAIPKLQRAVELFGEGPDAPRLLLAEVLYGQGRLDEAEAQFQRLLQYQKDNARAHLGLGRLGFRRGNLQESVVQLQRAGSDPRTRKASLTLLAEIHQRLGDKSGAERDVHQLGTLPEDQPWPDPYIQEMTQLQTGERAYLDRANRLLDQGRAAEAIPSLQQAVLQFPKGDWAWMLLGKALLQRNELGPALEALKTAVRLAPDSVEAQFHLGLAAFGLKDRRTAAACFRKVTELKPDAQAYYLLGHCLAQEGDAGGAMESFRKALRYKPNYPQAHTDLGTLLAQRGRIIEAVVHLQCAAQLDPANSRPRKLLQRVARQIPIPLGP
jgi:tetratricopeptide (TPR) repeat protein